MEKSLVANICDCEYGNNGLVASGNIMNRHSIHKGRTMWVVLPSDYIIMHLPFKMFAVYQQWLQGVQEVTITEFSRLIHSPSLVAVGLAVWYETWDVIGWHCPFVIGSLNNRLWLCVLHSIVGSHDPYDFSPFFRDHWQSLCTAVMTGKWLLLGLCKEIVKYS